MVEAEGAGAPCMSEPEALRQRRGLLLESIGKAADEFGRIDDGLSSILAGNRGQGGAGA